MKDPILSIGIIFKNDIRCIERCLKSLEPLRKAVPSELVMADTGSTDGSRAVAQRYADILIDFHWVNDFAAARNAVLDCCTGKWYVTVDTDEWLDPEFKDLLNFLESEDSNKYDMASLIQRNYQDKNLREYGDFFAMRLGRRRKGKLRYEGAIHEVLTFTDRPAKFSRALPRVILHHDGYVDVDKNHLTAKKKRNMALLRAELEKDPENIRVLLHCIDSAETDEEELEYVKQMEALLKRVQNKLPVFSIIAYQKCMQAYYMHRCMNQVLLCYGAWKAYSPQSALLRMDGEGMAAVASYDKNEYEAALEHIQNYYQALREKESGSDLKCLDRLYAQYNTDNPRWRSNLRSIEFQCLCQLQRFAQADAVLRETRPEELRVVDRGGMVLELLKEPERLTESANFLGRCWDLCLDEKQWEAMGEAENRANAVSDFIKMLLNYIQRAGRAGWALLAQMGDRTPARSARIVLSDNSEAIAHEWAGVTDWAWMFPHAYLHTMELRLALPDNFYYQTSEQMATLATSLANQPALPRVALNWLTHIDPPATPAQLTWQLDLVTAALRVPGWSKDIPVGEGLCRLYAGLSATYLDNIYNPELLNQQDVSVLPGMHRFAWQLRQALDAWEKGDELGYVRGLRAALDTAPAMKETVDFLLEHKPKTAAQRQLEELAEQVKAILSRYAPDDPAVAALKASPAYQKVAPLLEKTQPAPALQELTPVSPKPLEEALAGSQREIAASVLKTLDRWGETIQKSRTDYWKKFPLWGENSEEVAARLADALSEHGQDFRWLFDRLEDEQSRRVLTAVVRSWRFFDIQPLGQVVDHTYDDYFDRAILHCDENEVIADLGAYTGDTFLSYVKNYGSMAYWRYYCYEIASDSFDQLKRNTAAYPRVVLRRKGAGAEPGIMTLASNSADASANTLSAAEPVSGTETVEIVTLDQDITEPLTLIKMDIEGMEQAALRGCEGHIRQDRPKLALSVYHNFEDIWKLPRMIDQMAPGYRFYLRYHGGNLWPSEITLLAIPENWDCVKK